MNFAMEAKLAAEDVAAHVHSAVVSEKVFILSFSIMHFYPSFFGKCKLTTAAHISHEHS